MRTFWLCFVPLFIAVDPPGILPMFMALTSRMDPTRVRRTVWISGVTAVAVALGFLAAGQSLLIYMGITLNDFMIGGGLLLLVLSISDLLSLEKPQRRVDPDNVGVVPLGVPLIVGPAVLTTALLLGREHGFTFTAAALLANIGLAVGTFLGAGLFHRVLGVAGEKILSKIASLMMAALSVMLIRKGLTGIILEVGR